MSDNPKKKVEAKQVSSGVSKPNIVLIENAEPSSNPGTLSTAGKSSEKDKKMKTGMKAILPGTVALSVAANNGKSPSLATQNNVTEFVSDKEDTRGRNYRRRKITTRRVISAPISAGNKKASFEIFETSLVNSEPSALIMSGNSSSNDSKTKTRQGLKANMPSLATQNNVTEFVNDKEDTRGRNYRRRKISTRRVILAPISAGNKKAPFEIFETSLVNSEPSALIMSGNSSSNDSKTKTRQGLKANMPSLATQNNVTEFVSDKEDTRGRNYRRRKITTRRVILAPISAGNTKVSSEIFETSLVNSEPSALIMSGNSSGNDSKTKTRQGLKAKMPGVVAKSSDMFPPSIAKDSRARNYKRRKIIFRETVNPPSNEATIYYDGKGLAPTTMELESSESRALSDSIATSHSPNTLEHFELMMNEDFEPSYFVYSIQATSIVDSAPLIETADAHVPGMFQYEYDTVQCDDFYAQEGTEAEAETEAEGADDDDSEIEVYEDDLCVGVRRRAMFEPNKFGHRHKKMKDCIYESVPYETSLSEEDDGVRTSISHTRANIASLNQFSDEEVHSAEAANIELRHAGEGETDDAEEYAYYAIRYAYTIRRVLEEDVNVINTVQDGPPTIPLYERAYQWFKDVISVHFIHHKWKILAFSVVSIVIVVYFAIGIPSKEEARIPLVNEREPTASPTTVEYYSGADLLAKQSFNRTSLSEVLSEDKMVLFESSIENWLSYENVYSDSYSNQTVVTKCSIISQTVQNSSSNRKYNIRRKLDESTINNTFETVYILDIEYIVSYLIRSEQNFDDIEKSVNTIMEDSDSKDELAIILEEVGIYIDANGVGKGVSVLLPPIGKNFSALIL